MKKNTVKKLVTAALILVNLIIWIVPSNLAYNVAQERDILLGRYTVERTTTLLLFAFVSVLVINGIWSDKTRKREDSFKLIALLVSIIISIVAVDIVMRVVQRQQYIKSKGYYNRIPNTILKGVKKDIPPTVFSYPTTPAGYPDSDFTLTVDKRGFRNKTDLEKYEVVVLGDSFTEGSHVSDEQIWPVVFAQKSNSAVYNLGMSGGNPVTYLETLKKFGLELSPKIVICMLYEGNDFHGFNFKSKEDEHKRSLGTLFRTSPLRLSIKKAMIRCLGPINSNRRKNTAASNNPEAQSYAPSHPLYAVSWLPLPVPNDPNAKYYAFEVKRLLSHFVNKDDFLQSPGCRQTLAVLREIKQICNQRNIRFIVAYAPDKPHTLLPLVKDNLQPQKLRAFMALKEKNLPPAPELVDILLSHLDIQESAVEEFCKMESIEFVSLTQPLRQNITEGLQAYYTYDQHWTPIGQKIAAETLFNSVFKK